MTLARPPRPRDLADEQADLDRQQRAGQDPFDDYLADLAAGDLESERRARHLPCQHLHLEGPNV